MLKLLGPDNDLYRSGKITKWGWIVMLISSVFGFCIFLAGRKAYGRAIRSRK